MSGRNQRWPDVVYDDSYRHISHMIGVDLDEYMHQRDQAAQKVIDDKARRMLKAVQLSPTVYVCDALLRGERVPWQALDYWTADRYGVREGADTRDGRVSLDDFNDVPRQ